jgi:hypothetical protein
MSVWVRECTPALPPPSMENEPPRRTQGRAVGVAVRCYAAAERQRVLLVNSYVGPDVVAVDRHEVVSLRAATARVRIRRPNPLPPLEDPYRNGRCAHHADAGVLAGLAEADPVVLRVDLVVHVAVAVDALHH